MPWKENTLMSCRHEFVLLARQPGSVIRELCRRYEISPKTGYKWLERYEREGQLGLANRSRRPLHSPHRTAATMERRILTLHRRYPYWGPRKLHALLDDPDGPQPSTIAAILRRHGCHLAGPPACAPATRRFEQPAPNLLWQMDFKGHFSLSPHGHCHPFTLLDDHSRFMLRLHACANERGVTAQTQLIEAFRRYGLPDRITADNGPAWASTVGVGITAVEAWLMRLGVTLSHSRPHHPQTQGKLERLHRTLEREVVQARRYANLAACQHAMDHWRHLYNCQRPHEALGFQPPISRYRPSARAYPSRLPPIVYDEGMHVLKVRRNGQIVYRGRTIFVSEGLAGLPVAIRPASLDGRMDVVFMHRAIQHIDLRLPR
jgi:transposase InsO family protein